MLSRIMYTNIKHKMRLLDYTGDLYGQPVTLELWHFLRGERRFPSLEALQDEIRRNAGQTRAFFEK